MIGCTCKPTCDRCGATQPHMKEQGGKTLCWTCEDQS